MRLAVKRARLVFVLGTIFSATLILSAPAAIADNQHSHHHNRSYQRHAARLRGHHHRYYRYASTGLQCVPYARAQSGIIIKGNAANWWYAASGVYARGSRPEPGAVLNFRATWHMRLGHVAVVTNVLSPREIEVDHANWAHFGATHNNIDLAMHVIDVSPENDWTAVRVELGHTGQFGAVYPTYGFIYDRPDNGQMLANTLTRLHPTAERPALDADEVAEAPPVRDAAVITLPVDAPGRSLR